MHLTQYATQGEVLIMRKPTDLMHEVITNNPGLFQNPDTIKNNIATGWKLVQAQAKQEGVELSDSQKDLFTIFAYGEMATTQFVQDDQALHEANETSSLFPGPHPCFVGPV